MQRLSEDGLIAALFAPIAGAAGLGLRDDAAVIAPPPGHDLVITKDMLVAGEHFFAADPPDAIARKALRVNLSDLAAKGATPLGFCLGLGLPTDWTGDWLEAFARALGDDSRTFGCPLIGGDTVKMPGPLTLSITAFGAVPAGHMIPRGGARAGDVIYVTGTIGDAALGLRLRLRDRLDTPWIAALDAASDAALRERYILPRPRLGLAPALLAHARAAMDISDGLVGDLTKMLRLAGLTARIAVEDVPLSKAARAVIALSPLALETALTGGDDYELICVLAPEAADPFEAMARDVGIAIQKIGVARLGDHAPLFVDATGAALAFARPSFSHF
jgi:thiamine-monophosphate kinase